MIESLETDVLILGAGGAGLTAALHATDASPALRVTVVVKGLLGRAGCTRMVQGGYNAVFTEPDSLDAHLLDTLEGGGFINDQELVWTLVTEAPGRVLELESRYGCLFDRTPEGRIHQKPFAGQSHDRTIHKGDLTGIEIMNRLTEQVHERRRHPGAGGVPGGRAAARRRGSRRRRAACSTSGAARSSRCAPAPRCWRWAAGPRCTGSSRARPTSRPTASRSAIARACALRDMEMVQFHPTGLVIPGSLMTGALLEEGLRGAGGHLRNGQRRALHGALRRRTRMERSTRDLVSRASFLEVTEGRGTPNGGVWIDVSHLGAETVERNFRGMVRRCRDFGRDLARGPVEVGPTAHFLMGGVVDRSRAAGRRSRDCSRRARIPGACTAPTAWAATAWPSRPCSAASPAT